MRKLPVKQIADLLKNRRIPYDEVQRLYHEDGRREVHKLIDKYFRTLEGEEKENERLQRLLCFEESASRKGFKIIAGVDEVGRGPLAGPVVAAAVILPFGVKLPGLDDSKKLTEKKRENLYDAILAQATGIGIGIVEAEVIDILNIYHASLAAMRNALHNLPVKPQYILVDGFKIPGLSIPQQAIVKGDCLSLSIAAASVVAKVSRDRLMMKMALTYPGYCLDKHKGYGTREHFEALLRLGISPVHRRSFCTRLTKGGLYEKG